MKKLPLVLAVCAAWLGSAAWADELGLGPVADVGPLALASLPAGWAPALALDDVVDEVGVEFAAHELGSERVVKGAPYCADALHESVQTLGDGNRIVRKQQSRLCRDGEGRTRQEVDRNGQKLVWLRDPVAKQTWLLDPARKTARRLGGGAGMGMGFSGFTPAADGMAQAEEWRAFAERAREQAHEQAREALARARELKVAGGATAPTPMVAPVPPVPPLPPTPGAAPVVITRTVSAGGSKEAPEAKAGRAVEIQVLRLGDEAPNAPMVLPGTPMPLPAPPAAIHWQALHGAPRGPGVLTALGSKEVEGVRTNGERTTWTIEAGKIGNEKPIQIVRDVWTSPELLLTVQTRDADPRRGETIYRLANLKRGEPDAALMKVPADYAATVGVAAPVAPVPPLPPLPPTAPTGRKPTPAPSAPKG